MEADPAIGVESLRLCLHIAGDVLAWLVGVGFRLSPEARQRAKHWRFEQARHVPGRTFGLQKLGISPQGGSFLSMVQTLAEYVGETPMDQTELFGSA